MPGATFPMYDEIRPPAWAVAGARRLTLEEFGSEFVRCWRRVEKQVVKSECWQTYQEPDTKSLYEYQAGNYDRVQPLLETEADFDREVYEDVRANGTPFVRLRVVKLPLSLYLTYEMWNYLVRANLGETIEVLDVSGDPRALPNYAHFDFLLFDDSAALIHDYGTDGLQVGGWATSSTETLKRLGEITEHMRWVAMPLANFLRLHRISFPPRATGADSVGRRIYQPEWGSREGSG
jgi:hypothetical protein